MKTPYSTTTTHTRFLLLGDSHASAVGRAAKEACIPFQGGPIGAGRDFNAEFFDTRGDDVVFRNPAAEKLYREFLMAMGVQSLGAIAVPLVATFGFSAHFVATSQNWQFYRVGGGDFAPGFLTSELFDGIVRATVRDALGFYRHALSLGLRVVTLMPPQRVPGISDAQVFMAAQETVRREVLSIGAEVVDLRDRVTDDAGFQRPELCEANDSIHGNLAFGRVILTELLDRGI